MKRKEYQKPAMHIVKLKRRSCILMGSPVTAGSVRSNAINDGDIQSDEGYDGVVR